MVPRITTVPAWITPALIVQGGPTVPECRPARPPISFVGLRLVLRLTPRRKFTVYVVPHNHLDIGFTDYQPKSRNCKNRNFDRLLEEIRTDPSLRFSVDGVGPVEQFLRTRKPAAQKEFLGRLLHAKGQSCHAPGCNLRFSIINSIAWTGPYACWPMLPGNTKLCWKCRSR